MLMAVCAVPLNWVLIHTLGEPLQPFPAQCCLYAGSSADNVFPNDCHSHT